MYTSDYYHTLGFCIMFNKSDARVRHSQLQHELVHHSLSRVFCQTLVPYIYTVENQSPFGY